MSHLRSIVVGAVVLSQVLLACAAPAASSPTSAPAATTTGAPAPTVAAPTSTVAVSPTVAPTSAPTTAATASPAATTTPTAAATTPTASAYGAPAGSSTVQVAQDAKLGSILTGANGMTLYMYTKDTPNTSNCYNQCATNWPPLLTTSDPTGPSDLPGKLGTTTRKDGSKQVTYNTMPLYYFAADKQAGDTKGQEIGYVWYVVPPTMAGFPTVKVTKDSKLGEILTDVKGMTLYRYTKDTGSTSNCYNACATNWPPLLVSSGEPVAPDGLAGKLGTTTRKDGSKQVTYNGVPLYYFAADKKPGDTTGQNVGKVWFVVPESS